MRKRRRKSRTEELAIKATAVMSLMIIAGSIYCLRSEYWIWATAFLAIGNLYFMAFCEANFDFLMNRLLHFGEAKKKSPLRGGFRAQVKHLVSSIAWDREVRQWRTSR